MVRPEVDDLSVELDRVIGCPYPASLVNLAKHLDAADTLSIRALICERPPCAISKLASIVFAALPLWQYTIDILCCLSESPEFSSQLLSQTPHLLDHLLEKANSSKNAFEDHKQLCITLLSRPLPQTVPLPASAQAFFLQVSERALAADSLDENEMRSVYYMLNGACRGLLSLLPYLTKLAFEEKLCRIISSDLKAEDCMLRLWCFGIIILVEHPEALGNGNPPVSVALKWQSKAGKKIFEKDVSKTLQIACLDVMWITKEHVDIKDTEALESIRIASRTLQLVEQNKRDGWATSAKHASQILTRLSEKALRSHINSSVQLEALSFFALISNGRGLSSELVVKYVAALIETMSVADTNYFEECVSMSLSLFAPHMKESDIRRILVAVLQSNISPSSTLRMTNMRVLCDELGAVILNCSRFRALVLVSISSQDLQEAIESFLKTNVHSEDNRAQLCSPYNAHFRRDLISSTVAMLLKAAFSSGVSETPFPQPMVVSLLEKQQHLPSVSNQCTHSTSSGSHSPVSLFQQECTPLSGIHLQDWRERLHSELQTQDHYQRDSIVRSVSRICHDLESRCETVEAPLRHEREKSNRFENEIVELKQQISDLEAKEWQAEQLFSVAESDIEHLEQENDELKAEKYSVYAELEQLKKECETAKIEAEQALRVVEETSSNQKIQLQSKILALEEDTHTSKENFDAAQQAINVLSKKLQDEEEKGKVLANQLQAQLCDTECDLHNEQQTNTVSQQHQDLDRLTHETTNLQNQLQNTESELSTVSERLGDLQARHHELAQSSEEALEKLEEDYESDIRKSASKAEERYNQLHSELQDALRKGREMDEAYLGAQNDIHHLRSAIPPLEVQVQRLTDACSDKDTTIDGLRSQISGLQQVRRNMLKVMGMEPDTLSSSPSADETFAPRIIHSHRGQKSVQMPIAVLGATASAQAISNTTMETVANASFTSSESPSPPNESRPKRQRTSFKASALPAPCINKSLKPTSSKASPTKRSPLSSLSPNRRHTTVGFAITEEDDHQDRKQSLSARKRKASLHEIFDQGSFNEDSFLTGTPL
ncbi:hypothetical protein P280DRAFT_422344, partial [Massarina eburnea CBS 473.64]